MYASGVTEQFYTCSCSCEIFSAHSSFAQDRL